MNKFKRLADKLISAKMWKSKLTLIQLEKVKNGTNVVYTDKMSEEINCVKRETSKRINEDKFEFYTEFYVSSISVKDFDLDKEKLALTYNEKRYTIYEVQSLGTLNNEDAVVKFVVKK